MISINGHYFTATMCFLNQHFLDMHMNCSAGYNSMIWTFRKNNSFGFVDSYIEKSLSIPESDTSK